MNKIDMIDIFPWAFIVLIVIFTFGIFYYVPADYDNECLKSFATSFCEKENMTLGMWDKYSFKCGNERIVSSNLEFKYLPEEYEECLTKPSNSLFEEKIKGGEK